MLLHEMANGKSFFSSWMRCKTNKTLRQESARGEDAGKQTTKSVDGSHFWCNLCIYVITLTVPSCFFTPFLGQSDLEDGQKFELSASFSSISIISRWRCVCLHSHPLVTEMKRRWRVAWILLQCFPHVLQEESIPRMILEISLHENPSSAFIKLWDFTKVLAPSFDCIRNIL